MNLWFLAPELLAEIEISKDIKGCYRVRSHPSDKPKLANPEEIIRQLVLVQLRWHYHYPHERTVQEYVVQMGIAKKRADIAIVNDQNILESIIEVKQTIDDDSILQLQSYMQATGARFGAVISLHARKVFMRDHSGSFAQIPDLPVFEREFDFIDEPLAK
jgi:type I restriction enzyme M protein